MVTKDLVDRWREGVLAAMREDALDDKTMAPYTVDNKAAGSEDLLALRMCEACAQEDGFSELTLERGGWYSHYGMILIRVFIEHKGRATFFTFVSRATAGPRSNIEVAEYMVDFAKVVGQAVIEQRFFDVASLVMPQQG